VKDNSIGFRQLDEESQELIKKYVGRDVDTDDILITDIGDDSILFSYMEPEEYSEDPRDFDCAYEDLQILTKDSRDLLTHNPDEYKFQQGVFDSYDLPSVEDYVDEFPELREDDFRETNSDYLRKYIDDIVSYKSSLEEFVKDLEKEFEHFNPSRFTIERRLRCDQLRGHVDVLLVPGEDLITQYIPESPESTTEVDEGEKKLTEHMESCLKEFEAWANGDTYRIENSILKGGEIERHEESGGTWYEYSATQKNMKIEHDRIAAYMKGESKIVV